MNVYFCKQFFNILKFLFFRIFHYFCTNLSDFAYFSSFFNFSELRSKSCFLVCRSTLQKKKKKFHDFFRSINISNNSFFYVDVRFSAIIFVFFLKRNAVTRTFDSLLVSLETSFFLKLSERKKKNGILILICCSS